MKTVYIVNLFSIIGVVLTYFLGGIFLFIIALIPLGFIQVISSFFLLAQREEMNLRSQKLVSIYFLSILGWIVLLVLGSFLPNNFQFLAKYFGFAPILIAVYFMVILNFIHNDLDDKSLI